MDKFNAVQTAPAKDRHRLVVEAWEAWKALTDEQQAALSPVLEKWLKAFPLPRG